MEFCFFVQVRLKYTNFPFHFGFFSKIQDDKFDISQDNGNNNKLEFSLVKFIYECLW